MGVGGYFGVVNRGWLLWDIRSHGLVHCFTRSTIIRTSMSVLGLNL